MKNLNLFWPRASFVVFSTALFFCKFAFAEIKIVAGKKSALDTMTLESAKDLYLGRKLGGDGLRGLKPLDRLDSANNTRSRFYKTLMGWSVARTKAHWSQLVFTGKGDAPQSVASLQELVKRLQDDEMAIGFIAGEEDSADLKVLLKINE